MALNWKERMWDIVAFLMARSLATKMHVKLESRPVDLDCTRSGNRKMCLKSHGMKAFQVPHFRDIYFDLMV